MYDILTGRIASGYYPVGRKPDSVCDLQEEFKVSTTVINQTLNLLERDQLIVRVPASRCNTVTSKPLRVIVVFPEVGILPEMLPVGYSDRELVECLVGAIRLRGYRKCGCIAVAENFERKLFVEKKSILYLGIDI
ncbi:GntR family transcriptional regulator [Victivallis sp. Marseille-Q1083]|uniref:GntR family transcriptional regulator n=1 Tax=Victivallis sp. Marseille-Q1083 TaxID=2717288 RepID=UPI00158B8DD2|nr:GntR family transcriptional regulator [Victivallis sp. Marseille-Q1083]